MTNGELTGHLADALVPPTTVDFSITSPSIAAATEQLAALPAAQLAALRVYAGEHLAVILTTAAMRHAPVAIETDGTRLVRFDSPAAVSFSVRSLAGAARQVLGTAEFGATPRRFTTLVELVGRMATEIAAGAAELAVRAGDDASRNVFLVAHPFDGVPVEALDPVRLAPAMPPLADLPGICTVWVLLFPYHLLRWSVVTRTWADVVFRGPGDGGAEASVEPDTILEQADNLFRARYRPGEDSPFGFRVR